MIPPRREPQPEQPQRVGTRSRLQITAEAILSATVSVPWERPVHQARLAFLRRVAEPGEVSVHIACGTDRLGFIDAAYGLTTILTDVDGATLDILAQQFAEVEARFGPLPGTLQCRRLAVEALTSEAGFAPGSVHHLTLQNLFNAHLHSAAAYARVIDPLLSVVASGGSFFLTASEAATLQRQVQVRQVRLTKLGEILGYYDENVMLFQIDKAPR